MTVQHTIATAQGLAGLLCIGAFSACIQGQPESGPVPVGTARSALTLEPNPTTDNDATGVISSFSTTGGVNIDPATNPFFASLGTNGRTCNSCHKQDQAWTVSAVQVQATFNDSDGLDPIFRTVDGSNSPNADVSTVDARMAAYSLLLSRGVIRIGPTPPRGADYVIDSVSDPYGYATPSQVSFFRRPLPSTNVTFLTHVMWDGREDNSVAPISVDASLQHQANDATLGHAQGTTPLTSTQAAAIASFQESLFTAQANGQGIGTTQAQGANGGPQFLAGLSPNPNSAPGPMNLYDAWASVGNPHRQAVARGQTLFTAGVLINHTTGAAFTCGGTNGGCHNTSNVGNRANHDGGPFVDLNLADVTDPGAVDLPVYTVRRLSDNATRQVSDLGRGYIDGQFAHVGQFKIPTLRGLAARAPYFHNGSRSTLADVVNFYSAHFNLQLTAQQTSDLVAFLQAL